jgi:hypothetical protein
MRHACAEGDKPEAWAVQPDAHAQLLAALILSPRGTLARALLASPHLCAAVAARAPLAAAIVATPALATAVAGCEALGQALSVREGLLDGGALVEALAGSADLSAAVSPAGVLVHADACVRVRACFVCVCACVWGGC